MIILAGADYHADAVMPIKLINKVKHK